MTSLISNTTTSSRIVFCYRYTSTVQPRPIVCGHNTKAFKCSSLSNRDIKHFHATFYSVPKKTVQDSLILKYTTATIPSRPRSRKNKSDQLTRGCSIKYFVKRGVSAPGTNVKTLIPVCRTTFLGILNLSKDRVQRVCKRHLITGCAPKENRGGDRKTKQFEAKKVSIKHFMENLKGTETHYCRGKVASRVYLSSDLNISKLWRMYNSSVVVDLRVKQSYFRDHFNRNFNVGFGSPATDACSTCIMFREQLKRAAVATEKTQIMTELRIHKLKAKAFYDMVRKPDDRVIMYSYDCQKNLVLPKVPDQAAYYSRQLYYYNFTMCQGFSKDRQPKENVFIYVWKEHEAAKGSNEIASAIYDRLCHTEYSENVEEVRLVSDGCGGQNKNTSVVAMLSYWLTHDAPKHIKTIQMIFPIVGHSYIPPDRVFGRIEKVIRKNDTIIRPEDYCEILKDFGNVIEHGKHTAIFDWKSSKNEIFKLTTYWHFQFNKAKRISIKRSKNGGAVIRGEEHYRTDFGMYKGICKKGKTCKGITKVPLTVTHLRVSKAKLNDVDNLLKKHFGNDWQDNPMLVYYKEVLNTPIEDCLEESVEEWCEPHGVLTEASV